MLQGAGPDELEVIVVCNGCTDDTAARARAFGSSVRVIETNIASKSHALNLGDCEARGFPRFFVDADVVLPLTSIRTVAKALGRGLALAAAPRLEVDESGCSWAVRAYHRIWMRLPYVTDRMLGSGVYAISQLGRARFDSFPEIIGDDEFIRMLFAPYEKTSIDEAAFIVTPPRRLGSLIHINVRRRVGFFEMRKLYPDVSQQEARKQRSALLRLAAQPAQWPALAVYGWAKLCTVLLFAWRRRRGAEKHWARDTSSRSRSSGGRTS
jgi:glycosyltransferase involved in cell wall biosynthesis